VAQINIVCRKRYLIGFRYPEIIAEIMHLVPFVAPFLARFDFSAGENRNITHDRHIVFFIYVHTAKTVPFKLGIVFPGPLEAPGRIRRHARDCQYALFRSLKDRLVHTLAFRNRNYFGGNTAENSALMDQHPIHIYILIRC